MMLKASVLTPSQLLVGLMALGITWDVSYHRLSGHIAQILATNWKRLVTAPYHGIQYIALMEKLERIWRNSKWATLARWRAIIRIVWVRKCIGYHTFLTPFFLASILDLFIIPISVFFSSSWLRVEWLGVWTMYKNMWRRYKNKLSKGACATVKWRKSLCGFNLGSTRLQHAVMCWRR